LQKGGVLLKLIKKQTQGIEDIAITIEYDQWNNELEDIVNYVEGKKKTIAGYDENKSLRGIRLDKILYFEAVGELVFAYTKDNMFEIKMRLYQIEEIVEKFSILRASKSVLINIRKIQGLKPALNGRICATMENGEELLISRSYAKSIAEFIRSA